MNREIKIINNLFRTICANDMSNIEGISTGSDYKSKEEILQATTSQARSSKRFIYLIASCLDYLNEGGDFKDFIDSKLDAINCNNQCEHDRLDTIEDLNRLSEELIDID